MALTKLNNQTIADLTDFNLSADDMPSGSVLQVVVGEEPTSIAVNSTGYTFLQTYITPKSSSSKIIVEAHIQFGANNADNFDWGMHFLEDNVVIETNADSDASRGGNDVWFSNDDTPRGGNDGWMMWNASGCVEVSNTNTNTRWYGIWINSSDTRNFYINRVTNSGTVVRGLSTLKLTEVAT
jgi:hypothetical protein